jgi:hypothetical protein
VPHANGSGDDLTAGHDVDDPARKRDDCDAIAEIYNEASPSAA